MIFVHNSKDKQYFELSEWLDNIKFSELPLYNFNLY